MLPSDFPPRQTAYGDNGTWKRIHCHLCQWVRLWHKRHQLPSVVSSDKQSVRVLVPVEFSQASFEAQIQPLSYLDTSSKPFVSVSPTPSTSRSTLR